MQANYMSKKAGVSLIVVLMFMLVATIAATATWKWITSEGKSSESRMLQNEAYQSSIAGINGARAWMTFHANETGALIRQYLYKNDGTRKKNAELAPVNIDAQVRSFANGAKQDHHVWLMGVNATKNNNYKLKILSEGVSRDGRARHTEVAIFNVSGLYQVRNPAVQEENNIPIQFEYAYFGGSYENADGTSVSSAVVNGNWNGNPQGVTGNFVVTGNADLSGNAVSVGPLMCVGGNVTIGNQGLSATDVYIGGNVKNFKADIAGRAYFNGNVFQGSTGGIVIEGSATVNGKFVSGQATSDGDYVQVKGNLCTGENGAIVSKGTTSAFQVDGNVWMPGDLNLWFGEVEGSDCRCPKDEVKCTYKKCTCEAAWMMSEGECSGKDWRSKTCEEIEYTGPCAEADKNKWLNYGRTKKVDQGSMEAYYELLVTTSKSHNTRPCPFDDPNVISCSDYEFYSDSNNYNYAIKDLTSDCPKKNCGHFILGSSSNSEVHIKSEHPAHDYNSELMAKYFDEPYESDGQPRNCENVGTYNNPVCGKKYWHKGDKMQSVYRYYPYGKEVDGPENFVKWVDENVSGLYYMYSLPSDITDVSFGSYLDDHWKNEEVNLWGYFVNSPNNTKTKPYSFTNSYHTDSEGHPNKDSYGYYRFLNHTGTEVEGEKRKNKVTGTPYCNLAPKKEWRPRCGVNPWFRSNGAVSSNVSPSLREKIGCNADLVKNACDELWEESSQGCDGSSYLVKDPLVTAYDMFEEYANYGCAKSITTYDKNLISNLNACYDQLNKDEHKKIDSLYNGFLVVKVSGGKDKIDFTGQLKGRFIIIAEDRLGAGFIMDTEDDSYAFYYLKKGANAVSDMTRKNTFIYSEGQIGPSSQLHLTGTIYVTAASCAGLDKLQSSSLIYDPVLTQILSNAKVICSNDGSTCGGVNNNNQEVDPVDPEDLDIGEWGNNTDPYFISNAPQLSVVIETQYKTSEVVPVLNDVNQAVIPSFVILPRIIHITRDPSGKLADYFNIVPLNGPSISLDDANIECEPALNVTTNLVVGDEKLDEGLYECKARPNDYNPVPFYVWVYGTKGNTTEIKFLKPEEAVTVNEEKQVPVHVPAHGNDITLFVTCPEPPSGWSIIGGTPVGGGICSFTIHGSNEDADVPLFTVKAPSEPSNDFVTFVLQPGLGYTLGTPWSTSLYMASVATLIRDPVNPDELTDFCNSNAGACPPTHRDEWPNCPNEEPTWILPNWIPGYTVGTPNYAWSIVSSPSETLTLVEKPDPSCIVIIPSEDNSVDPPVEGNKEYHLRATGKVAWHKLVLEYKGEIKNGDNPSVKFFTDYYNGECEYDDSDDHTCLIPVFGNSKVKLSIDKSENRNKDFSYWKCTGTSCPTQDPVTGADFGGSAGFAVSDNNTTVEIHFGEQDKHCFFDEFRRGTVACNVAGLDTAQYCIDDCMTHSTNDKICTGANDDNGIFKKSKWHLLSGTLEDIATNQYPSYVMAASTAPDTGVKVISTVQAGIHGTLRALVQVPHQKSSLGRSSDRIRHSGFMLRSNVQGDDYLMLNVYENMSGHLEAQVCARNTCMDPQELKDTVLYNPMYLTSTSLVMLSATLTGADSLILYAFQGDYYYGSSYSGPTKYKALFKLSVPHASEVYSYVGFKLADKDFKLYGIGWRSEDYNSECFDGPPMVTCSYAAAAVDGIIKTGELTKPWVGYSGWFDNKNCSIEYWYYNGTDVGNCPKDGAVSHNCGTDGYNFDAGPEAGKHGYIDPDTHEEIKTAKVAMKCGHDDNSVYAWSESADHSHCGPFWTGKYTKCKTDIANLLGKRVVFAAGEKRIVDIPNGAKNLRGDVLSFVLEKETEGDVNLEIALVSKNSDWNSYEIESRYITISGYATKIVEDVNVVDMFATNTTTGFDPEHVTGVAFINHSNVSITVSNISAVCKYAVHFNGCSVEQYGESSWNVTVDIGSENIENVTGYVVTATVNGYEEDYLKTKVEPRQENVVISDTKIFENANKTYRFSVQLLVPGYENEFKDPVECNPSVTPSGITCTASDIDDIYGGSAWPPFIVTLSNCPSSGDKCKYDVTFSGGEVGSVTLYSETGKTDGQKMYPYNRDDYLVAPECNDNGGCHYTYTLTGTDPSRPFSCYKTFSVLPHSSSSSTVESSSSSEPTLALDCQIPSQSGKNSGATISVTPHSVSGCAGSVCSYAITGDHTIASATGSAYDGGTVSFTDADASDTENYVLTISHGTESDTCQFSVGYVAQSSSSVACACIAWVNGTGDYDQYCYSSGLNNMNDKCYTMNAERGTPPTHINNNAADTYWWTEVSCTNWTGCSGGSGVSSSSAATSSSAAPASSASGSGTPIADWTNGNKLSAGTYTIAKCNGNTGAMNTQITANFVDCWNAFSSKSSEGYWNNAVNNCDGQAVVSFPVTVTVPTGGTLNLSNCYK